MDLQENTIIRPKRSLMTLSSCRRLQVAVFILVISSYFLFIAHVLVNTVVNPEYISNEVTEESLTRDTANDHNYSPEPNHVLSVLNVSENMPEKRAEQLSRYNISSDNPIDDEIINRPTVSTLSVLGHYNDSVSQSINNRHSSFTTDSNEIVVDKTINVISGLNSSKIQKEYLPKLNEDSSSKKKMKSNKPNTEVTIDLIRETNVSTTVKKHVENEALNMTQTQVNVSTDFMLPLYCNGKMCLHKCCCNGSDCTQWIWLQYFINRQWDCAFNMFNDEIFGIFVIWTKSGAGKFGDDSIHYDICKLHITTSYYESQLRLRKGSILIKREWFEKNCSMFEVMEDFLLIHNCTKHTAIEGVLNDGIYEELDDDGNLKVKVIMETEYVDSLAGYLTDNLDDYKVNNTMTLISYLYITGFVLMSISTLCMIAIIMIYTCTPKLLNMNGKIIIQYLISVVIHNLTLFSGKMYETVKFSSVTDVVNRSSQFSWITWMTIMCFDIWYVFSHPLATHPHLYQDNKRFMRYFITAWGNVLLHLFLYTTFDDLSVYDRENLEKLFTTIGVILNTLMFLTTLFNMRFHNANKSVITPQRDSVRSSLRMYTKLFLLMGLDWLFALVCFESGGETISLVGVLIVQLQGIVLFILLVCNRRVLRILSHKYKK